MPVVMRTTGIRREQIFDISLYSCVFIVSPAGKTFSQSFHNWNLGYTEENLSRGISMVDLTLAYTLSFEVTYFELFQTQFPKFILLHTHTHKHAHRDTLIQKRTHARARAHTHTCVLFCIFYWMLLELVVSCAIKTLNSMVWKLDENLT